jgi:hypothetical protein
MAPVPWRSSLAGAVWIPAEAHRLGKLVSAQVGESPGVALATEVDEWAHVTGLEVSEDRLRQAVRQGVKVITTFDTLSHSSGAQIYAESLAKLSADFQ